MPFELIAHPAEGLEGQLTVPGDKSISHRALIFGALAEGETSVRGLLEADDVMRTAAALRALGASIEKEKELWRITGAPWQTPERALYCGNSGTAARLLLGAVAGQGIAAAFDGDRSLRSRPMARITTPLAEMGVKATSTEGRLPLRLEGGSVSAIKYTLPKPSAQLKSAILLAALGAKGTTCINEPIVSRDHTERMLPAFGVPITVAPLEGGGRHIEVTGPATLRGTELIVPADPSSAAFPLTAALIVPGSAVTITGVLLNPHRTGFLRALMKMGATLSIENVETRDGEEVGDLKIAYTGALKAQNFGALDAPAMIDEYPILAVAAAFAEGTSRFEGLAELRVKESDRLSATHDLLHANGVTVRQGEDWLEIDGSSGQRVSGGGVVQTHDDHRIAMAALVLGLGAEQPVTVDDGVMIATSFPGFADLMGSLGAQISG